MIQKLKIKLIALILLILIFINLNVDCSQLNEVKAVSAKKGIIYGRIMIPDPASSENKERKKIIPLVNAKVTVHDSENIDHTVFTDENGFYQFTEVAPGINYIITASGKYNEKEFIYKDVAEEVIAGEIYYAGIANFQSTQTASLIENLRKKGLFEILTAMNVPYCLP
jgi:hypothetical protein